MKKILMLCSIAFILSCSNDSDVKNEYLNTNESLNVQSKSGSSVETPKVEDDIDQLFYDYINSEDVINTNTIQNEFNEKLNFKGDYNQINTHEKLTNWVRSNIHLTEFSDVESAITEINYVTNLVKTEYTKFSGFYHYIENAPISDIVRRIDKWFPLDVVIGTNSNCDATLKSCTDGVSDTYAKTLKMLKDDDSSNKHVAANNAEAAYNSGMKKCKDDHKTCRGLN